jgi:hypothetical protein
MYCKLNVVTPHLQERRESPGDAQVPAGVTPAAAPVQRPGAACPHLYEHGDVEGISRCEGNVIEADSRKEFRESRTNSSELSKATLRGARHLHPDTAG